MTKDPNAPRISQQYRDRERRMVYELRHGTSLLVLTASESADATSEWRFEGHARDQPQLVVVGQWGKTRAEAFHSMRDLWLERGEGSGLARVDWATVATALTDVRAI